MVVAACTCDIISKWPHELANFFRHQYWSLEKFESRTLYCWFSFNGQNSATRTKDCRAGAGLKKSLSKTMQLLIKRNGRVSILLWGSNGQLAKINGQTLYNVNRPNDEPLRMPSVCASRWYNVLRSSGYIVVGVCFFLPIPTRYKAVRRIVRSNLSVSTLLNTCFSALNWHGNKTACQSRDRQTPPTLQSVQRRPLDFFPALCTHPTRI